MIATVGWVLLVAGIVWMLQGLDVPWAPQSFMTGDGRWVGGGAAGVVAGGVLLWWDRRKSK